MANPAFVPIDDAAKDGAFYLVRDEVGYQHCVRWNPRLKWFEYGNGEAVGREVSAYVPRHVR
jgi:hypothetical protein